MLNKAEESQRAYFDSEAISYDVNEILDPSPSALFELSVFEEFLGIPNKSTILELGCGVGRYTIPLLKKGYSVWAIDISHNSLEIIKDIYYRMRNDNWGLLKTSMEIPENIKTDAAICINFLHHVPDIPRTIREMAEKVKRGGIVSVFEPNPYYIPWHLYFIKRGIWNIERGILKCSPNNLKKFFLSAGLENVKIRRYGFLPTKIFNVYPNLAKVNALDIPNLPLLKYFAFHTMIRGTKNGDY